MRPAGRLVRRAVGNSGAQLRNASDERRPLVRRQALAELANHGRVAAKVAPQQVYERRVGSGSQLRSAAAPQGQAPIVGPTGRELAQEPCLPEPALPLDDRQGGRAGLAHLSQRLTAGELQLPTDQARTWKPGQHVVDARGLWRGVIARDADPVAALLLGGVERAVGGVDQRARCGNRSATDGDTHRERHRDGLATPRRGDGVTADRLAHSLADAAGHVEAHVRQEHHELVAGVTDDRLVISHRELHPLGDADQDLVPDEVAVRVVDLLEGVDVDHEQGQAVTGRPPVGVVLQRAVQVASVVEPREIVSKGEARQLARVSRGEAARIEARQRVGTCTETGNSDAHSRSP